MIFRKLSSSKTRKTISLSLLFVFLNQVIAPGVAYALTAGPTSPEATSFEPVDTTDMVNPFTGNFTYSLPLLEVPGPEGGYPLALSYHAGLQPNEEASWVGSGWSLNPGAITRSVNGFADDQYNAPQQRRDFWQGGSRSTFGISVGLPCGANFGLSFSQDTYQGFAVGGSAGMGFRLIGPIGIGVGVSVDGYGGKYAGADISITSGGAGQKGITLSTSVGISTNFSSISSNAGASLSYSNGSEKNPVNQSLLGISMSSNSPAANLSVGGGSMSVYNANAGKIQTESSGWGFGIPLPAGFSLGLSYNYTRYWSDETANISVNGSLYQPQEVLDQSYFTNRGHDIYRLPDPTHFNPDDNPNTDKVMGGTYPAYDDYSVTAQGLSGNIRPYIFQSVLYGQNENDVVERSGVASTNLAATTNIQYRFINDFSNTYRQGHNNNVSTFDTPQFGYDDGQGHNDGTTSYNSQQNLLAGSKNIKWFSNSDIINYGGLGYAEAQGFIDTRSAGFDRVIAAGSCTSGQKQVGGYMITNSSGVTYHYALPAYEYNEKIYTASQDESKSTTETKNEPYAYTWYLTAITGPDYVDRNHNGLVDDGDWGYWVSFDYGKWTSAYNWRNPSQGFNNEVDPSYKSYSQGTKEVYYLDAIRTRTHTALFVKEIRADGKSVGSNGYEYTSDSNFPIASLRLNSIMILKNDQLQSSLNTIRTASSNYNFDNGYPPDPSSGTLHRQNGYNIIDVKDIAQLSENLTQKCIRKIQFKYDYSLSPGVPNSYDDQAQFYINNANQITTNYPKLGKLTLLSVDFQGKGGAETIPPIEFQYDFNQYDPKNICNITLTQVPVNRKGHANITGYMKVGDMIRYMSDGGVTYYFTIVEDTGYGGYNIMFLGDNVPGFVTGSTLTGSITKNPPYNKDAVDMWGLYKSDYDATQTNENIARITSSVSNNGTDAWSLRKIRTNLGADINIEYEGDTYSQSVLNKHKSLIITSGSLQNNNTSLLLTVNTPSSNYLSNILRVGDKISPILLFKSTYGDNSRKYVISGLCTILGINNNQVTITAPDISVLSTPIGGGHYNTPPSFVYTLLTGNMQTSSPSVNYGGGIRVKNVIVDDLQGNIRKTSYNYSMPNFSGASDIISSGVTSYEPVSMDYDDLYSYLDSSTDADIIQAYRKLLHQDMFDLLTLSRVVPAPGVTYQYVTVKDYSVINGQDVPESGTTLYQYRTFNKGMAGIDEYQYHAYDGYYYGRNLSIKDYTSQVGNLIRTVQYDVNGNKLMETINHFLNDDIVDKPFSYQAANYEARLAPYFYQGLIQERYVDPRSIDFGDGNGWTAMYVSSGMDKYPIIQTGTTTIDYKNGTKIDQQTLGFDFYSGEINKTLTVDSYGNRFLTEITAAYHQYPMMGLKVYDGLLYDLVNNNPLPIHKNMLTQQASSYTYKVDANNNKLSVLSASAQTWSNSLSTIDPDGNLTTDGQSNIWRMQANYAWSFPGTSADNMTPYSSFTDFFANPLLSYWIKNGEVTQYDVYSNGLEGTDVNKNYSASRMGYNNSKVIISGVSANFNELAFSGVEDGFKNSTSVVSYVSPGNGAVNSLTAHTGMYSLNVSGGGQGFNYTVPLSKLSSNAKDYLVAVWVKPSSNNQTDASLYYQVGGQAQHVPTLNYSKQAAGWYLLEIHIPKADIASAAGSGNLTVGCRNSGSADLYFDDFRFQPLNASATAYVYDLKTDELNYILGNNNLYLRFEYDAAGRLTNTYKEVLGKATVPLVKSVAYHYSKTH